MDEHIHMPAVRKPITTKMTIADTPTTTISQVSATEDVLLLRVLRTWAIPSIQARASIPITALQVACRMPGLGTMVGEPRSNSQIRLMYLVWTHPCGLIAKDPTTTTIISCVTGRAQDPLTHNLIYLIFALRTNGTLRLVAATFQCVQTQVHLV